MLQYTSDNRKSNEYWNSQKSVKQNNKIINLKLSGAVVTQKKEDNVSKVYIYIYIYIFFFFFFFLTKKYLIV